MTLRPLLLVTIVATAAGCAAPATGAGETTSSSAPDADVGGAGTDAASPDDPPVGREELGVLR